MRISGLVLAGVALVLVGCGSSASNGTPAADLRSPGRDALHADTVAPADVPVVPPDTASRPDTPTVSDVPSHDVPATHPDVVAQPDLPARPDVAVYDVPLPPPGCSPCGYGSIRGRVCAPNQQVFVNGAQVWVDAMACNGAAVHVEATSDAAGFYLLENVPCGSQTVNVRKGSYTHQFVVDVQANAQTDVTGADYKMCFAPTAARLAVITGDWDNIEDLLSQLGLHADVFQLYTDEDNHDFSGSEALQLLTDIDQLRNYDILFIDCGWVHADLAASDPAVDANIKAFVEGGGNLYMSDFAFVYAERVWPWAIDFYGSNETTCSWMDSNCDGPYVMNSADLTGIVLDRDMSAYLGNPDSIHIRLGLSPLVSVVGADSTTTMHVIADIPNFVDPTQATQPLILSYRPTATSGKVMYTTFHNTEQDVADMQKVLQYLMFML